MISNRHIIMQMSGPYDRSQRDCCSVCVPWQLRNQCATRYQRRGTVTIQAVRHQMQPVPGKPSAGKNEHRDAFLSFRSNTPVNRASMHDTAAVPETGTQWRGQMPVNPPDRPQNDTQFFKSSFSRRMKRRRTQGQHTCSACLKSCSAGM